jgi:DNA-binding transcriptional LysR family regulator
MDLNEIKVFVRVAQTGSFTRAAKQLGIPNSTASAKVSALERRLGVTLLQRTTRKLRLTEGGEAYFLQASQGLEEIFKAEAEIDALQREPQGLLRVTAPIDLGSSCLAELISAFRKKYPAVNVELIFTSRYVDLVAEGVDVAMRAGKLRDSGLIARKVGVADWIPIASPAYLKQAGAPSHPKDLRHHACLQFTPLGTDEWQLTDGKHTVNVSLGRQLVVNEVNFTKALALAGNGIALLPSYICRNEIRSAKLVRILPEWRGRVDALHLVYPGQKFVAPKVRAFVDMASVVLKRMFEE